MLLFLWTDQVIDEINSWAEKSTKGLIKICSHETVLKEERKKNSLILANALYFKEAWLKNLMPRELNTNISISSMAKLFKFPS